MNEIEIWRAAKLLLDHHGERASFVAASRQAELAHLGDKAGAEHWHEIIAALDVLRLDWRLPAATIH